MKKEIYLPTIEVKGFIHNPNDGTVKLLCEAMGIDFTLTGIDAKESE